jgi:PDZ domain-containing secreted protein
MTEQEFMMVASETVANIRCGHTKVSLDDATQAAMESARKLPLQVLVQGRRLMVVTNDTPDDRTIRPGMEVIEINGHKVADILRRLRPQVSAEGDLHNTIGYCSAMRIVSQSMPEISTGVA